MNAILQKLQTWFMSSKLHTARKAIVAALVAGGAMYIKDSDFFQHALTSAQWWEVEGATATAAGLTWLVPNRTTPPKV